MIHLAVETTTLRWRSLPPLWVLVLIVLPAVVLGVRYLYKREAGAAGLPLRRFLGTLRALTVLLVLGAIFGPYAETVTGERFNRHLILCIDTSQSMRFKDAYASSEQSELVRKAAGLPPETGPERLTRLDLVKGLLTHDPAFLAGLAEQFRLHVYTFGAEVAGLAEPRQGEKPAEAGARIAEAVRGLQPDGSVTRIGAAIRDLVRIFGAKNEPVAGIVLLSDGRHTGGAPGPVEEARRAAEGTREGIPIFPVAIGDPDAVHNVGVSRVDAPEVVLAGDEVTFGVTVHARGFEGRRGTLEAGLLDADGSVRETLPIDAEPFELPSGERTVDVSFRYKFDAPGTYDLRIGVPPLPGEVVVDDNWQRHVVRVVRLKMRVLLVADTPNWEFRFLKEALLRAEDTISASVLLLNAEPEWPQPCSPDVTPLRLFPQEKSELAPFDVIILMDVNPAHPRFAPGAAAGTTRVLDRIEAWVQAGGGLILQAGRAANIPERYRGTKLMALLPVVPGDSSRMLGLTEKTLVGEGSREHRFRLTAAGAAHPLMRVLKDAERNREFWDADDYETAFQWFVFSERAKSGATALAVLRDSEEASPPPLIALQEYGAGKVLWIATDELWRMRSGVENLYYWRFWSGAIRHLATYRLLGGNKRIKLFLDRSDGRYRSGDPIVIEGKFLDENFEPVAPRENDPASQTRTIRLKPPEGEEQEITLQAVPEDPPRGIYRSRIVATRPGTYRLYADPGRDEERAERTFVVEETTLEMRDPLMDARTMEEIANASRGKMLNPAQFLKMVDDGVVTPGAVLRSGERRTVDLWDRSWVLYLFVGLLAIEWIVRRLNLLL